MAPRAELIPDGGLGAASEDFFRSPEFLRAEGVTHTLTITTADLLLAAPVLIREIDGANGDGLHTDAISPYGYPGLIPAGSAPGVTGRLQVDPGGIDWSPTGLVSLFLRHHLGGQPPLTGATRRNTVQISDPELPRKSRMSDRQQIRKNLKAGFEVTITPGPEVGNADRAAFLAAYTETMTRTGADPRYFFSDEYFKTILGSPLTWLFLIREPGGEVAAGSIAAQSDGMLHYYLSGTADAHLRGAPMKNILAEMTDFAWERNLPLNLGGGVTPGDKLEEFKRGFANREEALHTSEVICDQPAYDRLSAGRDAGDGYFPAYRGAPIG